jgi:hypothetical protein
MASNCRGRGACRSARRLSSLVARQFGAMNGWLWLPRPSVHVSCRETTHECWLDRNELDPVDLTSPSRLRLFAAVRIICRLAPETLDVGAILSYGTTSPPVSPTSRSYRTTWPHTGLRRGASLRQHCSSLSHSKQQHTSITWTR